MSRDRVYLTATLVLAGPVAVLVYLLASGRAFAPVEEARMYVVTAWGVAAAAAALGILALRAHMGTGSANTAALAAGLLGFAALAGWQGVHAARHAPSFLHLVFGPQARIVFSVSLLALAGGYVYDARERRRNLAIIASGVATLLAVGALASVPFARAASEVPAEDLLAVLAALDAVAAVLAGGAAILLVTKRDTAVPATMVLPIGIGLAAEQSLAYILAAPWTLLWWFAHLLSALSLLLVAVGVLVVWRESERESELRRLQDVARTKTEFINTAAHELCTPLTPIKLQVHLLKSSKAAGLTDDQRRAVDVLDRNVQRMDRLVKDVLEAARTQTGKLGLRKESVDLGHSVLDVAEAFEGIAAHSGVALEVRALPGVAVEADPKRVFQVLSNLMNNALKFTSAGGRIVLEVRREGDHALIAVKDDGEGMEPSDVPRLFQPFAQVHDPSTSRGGVGLGLFICRNIVHEHGGRIWAASEGPGRGTTVAFTLPLAPTPFHTTGVPPTVRATGEEH